jgi:EAL domain-containing protein (putative c-di-GMP-specific phosphodiesterase class I)
MKIEGVEALVRWQHPRQGLVMPDLFIPLLEETGHITSLTRWVFRHALRQLAEWQLINPAFKMSINISTRDLCDQDLAIVLSGYLAQFHVAADSVILEITESALMLYTQYTRSTLKALEDMGIQLAIDDFGIGYSSLSYLKELPVSELKIDKSFVINMVDSEDDEVIVRSTIDLGFNLGLQVVAEGVENNDACNILKSLHCQHAQGYFFSTSVTAEVLTPQISSNKPFVGLCDSCS